MSAYIGRFAPSPTGPLHMGSLVTALASWCDARWHGGQWLVRIEDVDTPRCVPDADHIILHTLAQLGMTPDTPPVWQSQRTTAYEAALSQLLASGKAYPCGCSRKEIADSQAQGNARLRHQTLVYPNTCRPTHGGLQGKTARAWRLLVPDAGADRIRFHDRWQGDCQQALASEVGDFVLKRADGLWAYQLAVVVDDAAQGITDIVRGADLLDSTARQIWLQQQLGVATPRYLHVPVVNNAEGEKLSKQSGALAIPTESPEQALASLQTAAVHLGLWPAETITAASVAELLAQAVPAWGEKLKALEALHRS